MHNNKSLSNCLPSAAPNVTVLVPRVSFRIDKRQQENPSAHAKIPPPVQFIPYNPLCLQHCVTFIQGRLVPVQGTSNIRYAVSRPVNYSAQRHYLFAERVLLELLPTSSLSLCFALLRPVRSCSIWRSCFKLEAWSILWICIGDGNEKEFVC